jgi:hypothetical protein
LAAAEAGIVATALCRRGKRVETREVVAREWTREFSILGFRISIRRDERGDGVIGGSSAPSLDGSGGAENGV